MQWFSLKRHNAAEKCLSGVWSRATRQEQFLSLCVCKGECMCVLVPWGERIVVLGALLCQNLQLSQTFYCGGGCGRSCWDGSSPCCCELGGWEAGQVLIPSQRALRPRTLSLLLPDAVHLRLLILQLRPSFTPLSTDAAASPPAPLALLTLYSSQRLSMRIHWSIGLTRSISTLALVSLIISSFHGWVFKDNWALEPAFFMSDRGLKW